LLTCRAERRSFIPVNIEINGEERAKESANRMMTLRKGREALAGGW